MRPGQAAPEFSKLGLGSNRSLGSFNEAGAGCPGIPARFGRLFLWKGKLQ